MRFSKLVWGCAWIAGLAVGCQSHRACPPPDPAKVTVRFFSPSPQQALASFETQSRFQLAGNAPLTNCKVGMEARIDHSAQVPSDGQHVVLWGGPFNGDNVTDTPVPLASGPYMFTAFDPDNGSAYQGWISVSTGGDDLASALAEWRNTIHTEQEWLAFEYKLNGKFSSHDPRDFRTFSSQLRNLRSLEARIDRSARAHARWQQERFQQQVQLLGGAQVLLMPGDPCPFTPCTAPAFDQSELSLARSGQPVTKVVLVGDYARTMEKLRRVSEMQGDLRRSRAVFSEMVRRLENRGNYYRLTDHLYHHGNRILENEQRLQDALGQIARIDAQLAQNARRENALLFIAGLFDPDQAFKVFDQQQTALQRERIVLETEKNRLDRMFDSLDEINDRRVALERQRQNLLAQMQFLAQQQDDIEQSRMAVASLRDATNVIHRQGPTCVLATSFVAGGMPARFVDAISRESMMTIRLQAAGPEWSHPEATTERQQSAEYELISDPTK